MPRTSSSQSPKPSSVVGVEEVAERAAERAHHAEAAELAPCGCQGDQPVALVEVEDHVARLVDDRVVRQQGPAELEQADRLPGQGAQEVLLALVQVARLGVRHEQAAERVAVARDARDRHEGIGLEGASERAGARRGSGGRAEQLVGRALLRLRTEERLEPHPVGVEEGDAGDVRAGDPASQVGQLVEALVGRGVEDRVAGERAEAPRLVGGGEGGGGQVSLRHGAARHRPTQWRGSRGRGGAARSRWAWGGGSRPRRSTPPTTGRLPPRRSP